MEGKTIEFKELVRYVHPDINPDITNAGKKMELCLRYRKDPVKLGELAILWGVIKLPPPAPKPRTRTQTSNGWDVNRPVPKPKPAPKPRTRPTTWNTRVRTGTKPRPVRPKATTLKPNTIYCDGTEAYHSKFQKWCPVNKTTPKMVYYWDSENQKTRKCSLKTMYLSRKQGKK